MKTSRAYQAAWDSEFNKLSVEDQATVLAAPDGMTAANVAVKAQERECDFFKRYYENETLNRLANTVWNGCVFGEDTMLDMMSECCDETQFIKHVNETL